MSNSIDGPPSYETLYPTSTQSREPERPAAMSTEDHAQRPLAPTPESSAAIYVTERIRHATRTTCPLCHTEHRVPTRLDFYLARHAHLSRIVRPMLDCARPPTYCANGPPLLDLGELARLPWSVLHLATRVYTDKQQQMDLGRTGSALQLPKAWRNNAWKWLHSRCVDGDLLLRFTLVQVFSEQRWNSSMRPLLEHVPCCQHRDQNEGCVRTMSGNMLNKWIKARKTFGEGNTPKGARSHTYRCSRCPSEFFFRVDSSQGNKIRLATRVYIDTGKREGLHEREWMALTGEGVGRGERGTVYEVAGVKERFEQVKDLEAGDVRALSELPALSKREQETTEKDRAKPSSRPVGCRIMP